MWIDSNCFNSENTYVFNALRLLGIRILRFDNFQPFADSLIDLLNPADPISKIPEIKVICSSSLCNSVYEELEKL